MSVTVTITITGLNEVQDFIHKVPETMMAKLNRIVKEAALQCLDYTKKGQNTPVVTNRLRSSIHIETKAGYFEDNMRKTNGQYNDKHGTQFDGQLSQKPSPDEIFVGTNVEYAPKIESKYHMLDGGRIEAQFYLTTKLHELTR